MGIGVVIVSIAVVVVVGETCMPPNMVSRHTWVYSKVGSVKLRVSEVE